ncbi:MAG: hypothetical protein DKINENOH_04789 [bacterium]|nr:hypothetical protein [bacterium]
MFRRQLLQKGLGAKEHFRWRGGEVSRIEGFTDAVFAFAITLLVVSLEVPASFDELMETMKGFAAFGVTFTALVAIWYAHYLFFRRYGLQDGFTFVLNAALLFVILFYVYPLKFLFTLLINYGLLARVLGIEFRGEITIKGEQWEALMIIYGLGFLAVFLVFVLLHGHAYRKRHELALTPVEILTTRASMTAYGLCVGVALSSIGLVVVGGRNWAAMSGWLYALIGPLEALNGLVFRRQIQKLKQDSAARASPANG